MRCSLAASVPNLPDGLHRQSGWQTTPLGIAALEDKIVQQAVVTVLTPIYEAQFLGFSYGFRPGRNQHQALDALWVALHRKRVNWVLDADIRSFLDVASYSPLANDN
jgi:retron-type reverse transcriptase